jgi:uncharacterized protein (UPF0147 family)
MGNDRRAIMAKLVTDPDLIAQLESDSASSPDLEGLIATASSEPPASSIPQGNRNLIDVTPEMLGGMAGGLAAAARGTPTGIALSAIGGAGGEGFHQVYQHLMNRPDAPQNVREAASRMAQAAGAQGAGELVGRWIIKAASPFQRYLAKDIEIINDWLSKAMGRKEGFTPAQATENQILDTLEEVARGSFTGGETMRKFSVLQAEGAKKVIDNFVDTFGKYGLERATPEQIGIIFRDATAFREKAYRRIFRNLYGKLDDIASPKPVTVKYAEEIPVSSDAVDPSLIDPSLKTTYRPGSVPGYMVGKDIKTQWPLSGGTYGKQTKTVIKEKIVQPESVSVDIRPLKIKAEQILSQKDRLQKIGMTKEGISMLEKISKLDDNLTFREAHDLRSAFMDEYGNMTNIISNDSGGARIAKQFAKDTYGLMETAAKKQPGVYDAWRRADTFYKGYQEKFNTDFMKHLAKIAETQPEKVVPSLFRPKAITQIRSVMDAVPPKTQEALRAAWLRQIMLEAENDGDILVGHTFKKKIKNMGQDTLNVIFPDKKDLQNIYNIASLTERLQEKAQAGGGTLIKLMQAGAAGTGIAGLALGDPSLSLSGGSIFIAPWVLSKLMTNRVGQVWLAKGLMTKPGTKEGAKVASKLIAEIVRIKSQDNKSGSW